MAAVQNSKRKEDLDKIVSELLRFDQTFERTQEMYSEWGKHGSYDDMIETHEEDYAGPALVKEKMKTMFDNPEKALVLDLGAGTGIIGSLLLRLGYKDIHALEPCKNFVDILNKKGIYQKVMEQVIGGGTAVAAEDNTYDAVVTVGTFCPGHIPCDSLHEIIRVLKPGGYFMNCMRTEFLSEVPEYKDRLEPLMEQLEKDGQWKKLVWETYANHYMDKDGIAMIFQKC